ncbi:hypothetical protein WNY78_00820 [Psychroserpens sp. AS72]|uniref:hypothetical protein n=1 Tax=Psychroserpens sp. AS72 TaxID=3135775 RepID=UPI0031711D32
MNNTFKKIIKGTVAIFAIKVALVIGIFVFQSCQSERLENETSNEIDNKFLNILDENRSKLTNISVFKNKITSSNNLNARDQQEYEGETYTVCLMAYDETTTNSTEDIINNIENIGDLIISKTTHQLIIGQFDEIEDNENQDEINYDDCIAMIEIPIQPVLDALNPVTSAAKQYFYNKGFTETEIIEMLDGEDESTLIPIVMNVVYSDNTSQASIDFLSVFGESAYAQNGVRDCFLEATGIAAGVALVSALTAQTMDKKLVKKLVKTAVKKIGGRVLGGIGLALMVAEFAWCLTE